MQQTTTRSSSLKTIFLALALASHALHADGSHKSIPTAEARSEASTKLEEKVLDLVLRLSGIDNKPLMKEKYALPLVLALEAWQECKKNTAGSGCEAPLAALLAEFSTTMNAVQIFDSRKEILEQALLEESAKRDKTASSGGDGKAVNPDELYIALLKRLLHMREHTVRPSGETKAKEKVATGSTEAQPDKNFDWDLEEFKSRFATEYANEKTRTEAYYAQLEAARNGDEKAREALLKRNPTLLLSFLDKELRTNTQKDGDTTKGKKFADLVLSAIAQKQGDEYLLGLTTPAGKNWNISLGKDPSKFVSAFAGARDQLPEKSFAGTLAPAFEKPDKRTDGTIVVDLPVTPRELPQIPVNRPETGTTEAGAGSGAQGGSASWKLAANDLPTAKTSEPARVAVNQVAAAVVSKCAGCHAQQKPNAGFRIDKDHGLIITKETTVGAFADHLAAGLQKMIAGGHITEDDKTAKLREALQEWKKAIAQ